MFMFNYNYSPDNPAIVIALTVILMIGIIGLGLIFWENFRK